MSIEELKKQAEKRFQKTIPRFDWKTLYEAFGWIKHYYAFKAKIDDQNLPAVTIVFKNQYRAKCFIYWMQILSKVDPYQATVYLEEEVREIYKDVK